MSIEGLEGTTGDDKIGGTSGDDVLQGLEGNDTIYGGAGNDVFQFLTADAIDRIMDFAAGDRIDLSQIDANALLDGDQAFAFIGDGEFSGAAGELRYDGEMVHGDLNGDAIADFSILISNHWALQGGDFTL